MTRENLQNIFRKPYSFDVWQSLLINLFGASEVRKTPSDIACDNDNVVKGEFIGELNTSDRYAIGLFAFEVNDNTKIAINRIGLRRLVHNYTSHIYDAAIAIFYNDKQWRLSFICDLKDEGTAPKRYTYVFGNEAESYRTAALQLFKLYDTKPTFQSIKDAFSVEKLSKDFFTEYKKQYDKFVKYINDTKQNSDPKHNRDYVKKMMGRLVFLQFLQKKGWMNGDPNYLQNLYAGSEYKDDFLEQVLEPLFFEVLNTKECYRDSEKLAALGGEVNIPYLNGGLFERDANDKNVVVFEAKQFEELFEFFSHYNFTIDENDPYDSEVGIDPEMLGHIFENLLEDNKDKGAFYTPKEIVQYMCRQSLIEYLQSKLGKNDDIVELVNNHQMGDVLNKSNYLAQNAAEIARLLDEVKICDPAIGSGAFPMGILNEIFHLKLTLNPTLNACRAEVKRGIIQNSIYGVDIEQGAVDIARLRFWLSLVVDEDVAQPLPNLDYKIMCGNSLLSRHALDVSLEEAFAEYNKDKPDDEKVTLERLKRLDAEFTLESDKARKNELRELINDVKSSFRMQLFERDRLLAPKYKKLLKKYYQYIYKIEDIFGTTADRSALSSTDKTELAELEQELSNKSAMVKQAQDSALYENAFEWRFEFPALLGLTGNFMGFDIVIGNPPYISSAGQERVKDLKEQRNFLKNDKSYTTLYQKWDIFIPFIEKGLKLLNEGGVCTMIVPYPLTNQIYARKLRELITNKYYLSEIVDLNGTKIFENATVSNCIPFIINKSPQDILCITGLEDKVISHKVNKKIDDLIQDKNNWIWNVGIDERNFLKHKEMHVLGDFCYVSKGMVLHSEDKEFTKKDLISIQQDYIHCKKYLEAKDMDKYSVNRVRYLEWNTSRCPSKLSRPTFPELYDNAKLLFNCLGEMKVSIDLDSNYYCEQSIRVAVLWHNLKSVNNKSILASIKRYSRYTRSEMEEFSYCVNEKYILGLLNSKYAKVLLTALRGGDYHVVPEHIRNLPIPIAKDDLQLKIIKLVDCILEIKQNNTVADTSTLEAEIDQMVYTLYNLTPEEITLIENK